MKDCDIGKSVFCAIDKDGSECLYDFVPPKFDDEDDIWNNVEHNNYVNIPSGSIFKLTGINMTYKDKPIELFKEIE